MGWLDIIFPSKGGGGEPDFNEIQDPHWARSPRGGSFNFLTLDPDEHDLDKASGVYVIWHGGVKPEWLYVGASNNIASDLYTLGENEEITSFENRGGVFVSWAFVKGEYQNGVVTYLTDVLKPVVANPSFKKAKPIPVTTP